MKTSKKAAGAKGVNNQLTTLHQRLYQALNLGFRGADERQRKWQSNDVELQRLVLRSLLSYLDYVTAETSHLSLVKHSVDDVVKALVGIVQSKQENVLAMASTVIVKLVSTLPNSTLHPYLICLVDPLASLLSCHLLKVAVPCATALKIIISNLRSRKEKEVWQILKDSDAVAQIIRNLRKFSDGMSSAEYLSEMISLLAVIVEKWPPSRYPVWSNAELVTLLEVIYVKPDNSLRIAILQLYSALALCGKGAEELIDRAEALTKMIMHCMDNSQPQSVRLEAFKLARRLMVSEQACSKLSCECIVKIALRELSGWSSSAVVDSQCQRSLLTESCILALITRWPGKHHTYLWKLGVDKVLLDIMISTLHQVHPQLSTEELITLAQDGLRSHFLSALKPFIWEILGWLVTHCTEDLISGKHTKTLNLNILVTTACLAFVDSFGKKRHLSRADPTNISRSIAAGKATLMIMCSPWKYIACQARSVLSELLKVDGVEYLKYLLHAIDFTSKMDKTGIPDENQIVIWMMGLTCYSSMPEFCGEFIQRGGIKTLLSFVKWWLNSQVYTERLTLPSYFQAVSTERTCCRVAVGNWEGNDILLFLAFFCLSELLNHCGSQGIEVDIFTEQKIYSKEQLLMNLHNICVGAASSGLRWYSSYLLSFFGSYGFPSKLGHRIGTSFSEKELADLRLVLKSGQFIWVHNVILSMRCPSLVPRDKLPQKGGTFDGSSVGEAAYKDLLVRKEVTLSGQVDYVALVKVLDFVYSGNLRAGEDIRRKLKILARHCNLQSLLLLLSKKRPIWGTPYPIFDLTPARDAAGHIFPDIILVPKTSEDAEWTCSWCPDSSPHLHVHKIIVWSCCGYIQAMFQSGMRESHSQSLDVPVNLKALEKLVDWLYSDKLPKPASGCLWDNMELERKLQEVQPYIELCWLAEFWLLDDIIEESQTVVISCLDSAPELSVKIIQMCADLLQLKLVEVAANYMAPVYQDLRLCGDLDCLSDDLVDIVRAASVKYSQDC